MVLKRAFFLLAIQTNEKGVMIYMKIEQINIMVTDRECGYGRQSQDPADLTAYLLDPLPHAPGRLRPAVVICPGGGYGFVSPREDQPVAMEFLNAGFQVFVLHYHVEPEIYPLALLELARAVSLIRASAGEWAIDPLRITVCGFSAGGHLAGCLGTMWNRPSVYGPLGLSARDIRPDSLLLCYPVITSGEHCHQNSFKQLLGKEGSNDPGMRALVSLELQAGPHVPRTFLWHTWTDPAVPVENSLLLAQALKKAGVSLEMHIYPHGKHGLSLANQEVSDGSGDCLLPHCQGWIRLAIEWEAQAALPSGKE